MSRNSKESHFDKWELFFSRTRNNGVIKSGNSVFARVSKYPMKQMQDKAHSIVRHPDMPRAVFKYMWDEIKAGRTISAYIKNKASDSSHYWVLATVFPYENDFVSVRIKPTSKWLAETVEPLYKKIKDLESSVGMDEQIVDMCSELNKLGFSDYQHFMQSALKQELNEAIDDIQNVKLNSESATAENLVFLQKSMSQFLAEMDKTSIAVKNLELGFVELNKLAQVQDLLPFNLTLSTQKSKATQKTMEVLSSLFAQQQKDIMQFLKGFREVVTDAEVTGLSPLRYEIGACFLQVSMAGQFLTEIESTSVDESFKMSKEQSYSEANDLLHLTSLQIEKTLKGVNALRSRFGQILLEKEEMGTLVKTVLSIAQLGQVEISQDESIKSSAQPHLNGMRKMAEQLNNKITAIGTELARVSDSLNNTSRGLIHSNKKCIQAQIQMQKSIRTQRAA